MALGFSKSELVLGAVFAVVLAYHHVSPLVIVAFLAMCAAAARIGEYLIKRFG
ncbi:hypothetical protein JQ617_07900 [Bradyrhizobium sp. KB893862 SZCCT0404]|uniref:hypothetical protein n=1 Tax=Bradyrhizobium sp. KB893862 SZCCT0404 TaxID=2807672 RepID=UPI001BA6CBBD|nr:hypothetical protein [Bradyrhizobium sp. KB893862 SZCCT0404]MBR1173873.1 hypothetical protein [Bradyrhizobium sp. KB893862 SZCCT0404]